MPIDITCASCGTKAIVPDSAAGRTGKCRRCGQQVRIPIPQLVGDAEPEIEQISEAERQPDEAALSHGAKRAISSMIVAGLAVVVVLVYFLFLRDRWENQNRNHLLALKSDAASLVQQNHLRDARKKYAEVLGLVAGHQLRDTELKAAMAEVPTALTSVDAQIAAEDHALEMRRQADAAAKAAAKAEQERQAQRKHEEAAAQMAARQKAEREKQEAERQQQVQKQQEEQRKRDMAEAILKRRKPFMEGLSQFVKEAKNLRNRFATGGLDYETFKSKLNELGDSYVNLAAPPDGDTTCRDLQGFAKNVLDSYENARKAWASSITNDVLLHYQMQHLAEKIINDSSERVDSLIDAWNKVNPDR